MIEKLSNLVINDESGSVLAEAPRILGKTKKKELDTVQPNNLPNKIDYMFIYLKSHYIY